MRRPSVALAIAAGIGLSLLIFAQARRWERAAIESEFHEAAAAACSVLADHIEEVQHRLKSTGALFLASDEVRRDEFRLFAAAELSGPARIQSLHWVPRIAQADRGRCEDAARKAGFDDFEITEQDGEGRLVRARQREAYFPYFFVEPRQGSELVLGFDLASDPTRRETLERSRDSGQVAVTPRISLVQEKAGGFGVLVFLPIFAKGRPADTVDDRRASLEGFVVGAFRADDLVREGLCGLQPNGIDAHLYDVTIAPGRLLGCFHTSAIRQCPERALEDCEICRREGLFHETKLRAANREWVIMCTPAAGYVEARRKWQSWTVLAGGLAATALLAAYLLAVTGQTARVQRLIEEQTGQLQESEQRFRSVTRSAADGIIMIDPLGRIAFWNDAAARMFGYSEEEAIGKDVHELLAAPQHLSKCRGALLRFQATGQGNLVGKTVVVDAVRKNGETFPVELAIAAVNLKGRWHATAIARDTSERRRAQNQIARHHSRLWAINQLFEKTLACESVEELARACLALAEGLTASKFGFVGEVNGEGRFDTIAQSDTGWEACRIPKTDAAKMIRDMEIRGLWGKVVRDGEPLTTNHPSSHPASVGTPQGHPPITAFLGVPLKHGSQAIGVLALANKEGGYDLADREDAEALSVALVQALVRNRAERALRESEQRYRELLSAVTHYTYSVAIENGEPVSTHHSPGCLWTTGYAAEDYASDPNLWFSMVHPDDRETVRSHVAKVLAGESVPPLEHRILHKGGTIRWIRDTIVCHRDAAGQLVRYDGLVEDVTERKRAEEELKGHVQAVASANRALEALARAAETATRAKSEFLANMSHEIRTPMTAILGFTDVLIEENGEGETRERLQVIKRNGQHLLQLMNDILDLSKIEAGALAVENTPCSLSEILDDVKTLARVRANAQGLALSVDCRGRVPARIHTDPVRFRQILVNLVGNAIKFTERGSVHLAVQMAPGDQPMLQCDICDTGIGLTPEQAARLFQPFSQADSTTTRKFGGTGLGLAISKRLAERLGGNLALLSSQPGVGSQFRLTLPTGPLEPETDAPSPDVPSAVGDAPVQPAPLAPLPRPNCRVLLAEDGPDNQRLIAIFLKKAGVAVTIVENGQRAVDAALSAQRDATPFDLILMDMQMPVLDGYEATSQLRQAGYAGGIIALTAHAMSEDRQKCLGAGCDDYLSKPFEREKLLAIVARCAARPSENARPEGEQNRAGALS